MREPNLGKGMDMFGAENIAEDFLRSDSVSNLVLDGMGDGTHVSLVAWSTAHPVSHREKG